MQGCWMDYGFKIHMDYGIDFQSKSIWIMDFYGKDMDLVSNHPDPLAICSIYQSISTKHTRTSLIRKRKGLEIYTNIWLYVLTEILR